MDNTDKLILEELLKNSRITMKELGQKVHMTGQAVSSRILKLEERGAIEGYTIKINESKLGYTIHAMITVYTRDMYHQPYLNFVESKVENVINNYKTTGGGCYLLECKFRSNEELDNFLVNLNEYVNYKLTIIVNETRRKRPW